MRKAPATAAYLPGDDGLSVANKSWHPRNEPSTAIAPRLRRTCFAPLSLACMLFTFGLLQRTACLNAQGTVPQLLSLQNAITLAERANPESALATARQQAARAGVQSARSTMLPHLAASETLTDSTDPVFAFGARLRQGRFTTNDFSPAKLNHPAATTDFQSAVGASWNMFDSGKSRREVQAARSQIESATHEGDATRHNLAYQTVRAYYRALLADQERLTTAAAVTRARSFRQQAQDRMTAGLALASEGLQADVELSQREQDAAEADSNVSLAYADLEDILGGSGVTYTLIQPQGTPAPVNSSLEELQAQALRSRPDLAAARSKILTAAYSIKAARDAYGPAFSSFADVQADNPHLASGGGTNWTVGGRAEINLFDGGVRKAELSKARAERLMAQAAFRQAQTKANLQVRQAFYALQTSRRQYNTSSQMLAAGQETLRTALNRYSAGLATITEVLTQQDQLRAIELNRVESLYRWWTTDAQLRFATGENILTDSGTHP